MKKSTKPIRYAVVALGHIVQNAVLPAFAHARNSKLAALITGDPEKGKKLSRKYGVPAFHYDDLEQALRDEEIEAAYVAMPNVQHRAYTERCARVGVHVLCEKPMAAGEADCKAMIAACEKAKVHLMIAYRLHFDPMTIEAIRIARSGELGELRYFSSVFGMQAASPNIRLNQKDGGGALLDLGVYCVNAARYLFGTEPVEVVSFAASNSDPRFKETEEMHSAVLRFPGDRLATFTCSFNAVDCAVIELVGTKGKLRMDPAYSYTEPNAFKLTVGEKSKKRSFPFGDQFAPELVHFSDCIRKGRKPEPDGREGFADVRILNAIAKAAESGRAVKIAAVAPQKPIALSQAMKRPPARKPKLVNVKAPAK